MSQSQKNIHHFLTSFNHKQVIFLPLQSKKTLVHDMFDFTEQRDPESAPQTLISSWAAARTQTDCFSASRLVSAVHCSSRSSLQRPMRFKKAAWWQPGGRRASVNLHSPAWHLPAPPEGKHHPESECMSLFIRFRRVGCVFASSQKPEDSLGILSYLIDAFMRLNPRRRWKPCESLQSSWGFEFIQFRFGPSCISATAAIINY